MLIYAITSSASFTNFTMASIFMASIQFDSTGHMAMIPTFAWLCLPGAITAAKQGRVLVQSDLMAAAWTDSLTLWPNQLLTLRSCSTCC